MADTTFSAGTVIASTWLNDVNDRVYTDFINVMNHGAVGDGVTNDTSAIAAARALAESRGAVLLFPAPHTFLTDPIVSAATLRVHVERGATVKLRNSAATVTVGGLPTWAVFVFSHSNCALIVDGVLDGNRANQDKAGFLAAGVYARQFQGVIARGTVATPITGLKLKVNAVNVAQFALACRYVEDFEVIDVSADDCGGLAEYWDCERFSAWRHFGATIDHDAWYVYPHALDVFRCQNFFVGGVSVADHAGYGVVASGTSLSDWVSGLTVVASKGGVIEVGKMIARDDGAMQKMLAISIIGNTDVDIRGGETYGYSDNALEFGGNTHCRVIDQSHDGAYKTSSLGTPTGVGVQVSQTNFSDEEDDLVLARALRTNTDCELIRVRARRFLSHAWTLSGADGVRLTDCEGLASFSGMFCQVYDAITDSFTGATSQGIRNVIIGGGEFSHNEIHGFWGLDGDDIKFVNGTIFRNNGQGANYAGGRRKDASAVSAGDGLTTAAGNNKSRWVIDNISSYDDQTTTGSYCSVNPSAPTIISVSNPKLWREGQIIKIIGGGVAGADLTTMINKVDQDNLTLRDALSTFPTVAGTGTISTSSRTVTGVGTSLSTEVPFRAWIVNGGNYRQIVKTTSATAGYLASPFPANLSGAAVSIVRLAVDQVRSQRYGVQLAASVLSPALRDVDYNTGNVTANLSNSTASSTPAIISTSQTRFDVLASSAVVASHTGSTAETTLRTVTIPGGTLSRNGAVRITAMWSHTNNANNKTLRIKIAGTTMASTTVNTSATTAEVRLLWNASSATSQKGFPSGPTGGLGTSTAAIFSAANNTANDLAITFTVELANSADTAALEAYTVEVLSKG